MGKVYILVDDIKRLVKMGINKKLEALEDEVSSIKSMLIKLAQSPQNRKIVSLKGLLKGIKVEEQDIEEAYKAWVISEFSI